MIIDNIDPKSPRQRRPDAAGRTLGAWLEL